MLVQSRPVKLIRTTHNNANIMMFGSISNYSVHPTFNCRLGSIGLIKC